MTTGVKTALSRGSVHSMCTDCGFPLPKYPGRYPKACPSCGTERKTSESVELTRVPGETAEEGETITIGGRTGTIVEDRDDELLVEWPDGEQETIEL